MREAWVLASFFLLPAFVACGGSVTDPNARAVVGNDGATNDAIPDGGVCTPDPPDVVISGTSGGQLDAPYCPWNGCLDAPKASCGHDGQWHCPAPPAQPCHPDEPGTSQPEAGTSTACSYPTVQNDPRCPAHYAYTYGGQPCAAPGLSCSYPGMGDGEPNGCFATAELTCKAGGADAGPDASASTWVAAQ